MSAPGDAGPACARIEETKTSRWMRAAAAALYRQQPARLVVAVPVAAPSTCQEFKREVDDVVCAMTPEPFYAVGVWYESAETTLLALVR